MVLRNAGRLTEAAILRNPVLQGIRNTVAKFAPGFPSSGARVADLLAELNIGYPESPLDGRGRASRERHQGRRALAGAPAGRPRQGALHRHGPGRCRLRTGGKFPKLVQAAPASGRAGAQDLILVRPDGYVGFAGAAADRAGAEAYLAALAAR